MKALTELQKIINTQDYDDRQDLYIEWLDNYVYTVNKKQLVFNKTQLTSNEHDFICEHLIKECVDELIENNLVKYDINKNVYEMQLKCLKFKEKINE